MVVIRTALLFNDVKVPRENLIGEEGFGFTFAMRTLNGGRIGIASQALGIASGAYERSVEYAKQRKAFGKEIATTRPYSSNWPTWPQG